MNHKASGLVPVDQAIEYVHQIAGGGESSQNLLLRFDLFVRFTRALLLDHQLFGEMHRLFDQRLHQLTADVMQTSDG